MITKRPKMMRPRDARSHSQVAKIPRDNVTYAGTWALLNGDGKSTITITRQRRGENATESISIPRRDFDRIVDWYMKPVKVSE